MPHVQDTIPDHCVAGHQAHHWLIDTEPFAPGAFHAHCSRKGCRARRDFCPRDATFQEQADLPIVRAEPTVEFDGVYAGLVSLAVAGADE